MARKKLRWRRIKDGQIVTTHARGSADLSHFGVAANREDGTMYWTSWDALNKSYRYMGEVE